MNAMRKNNCTQHAIKYIGRKVLKLNDITFNIRLGKLKGRNFEMPTFLIVIRYRQA